MSNIGTIAWTNATIGLNDLPNWVNTNLRFSEDVKHWMSNFIINIAPEVYRKRFLIEGYYSIQCHEGTIIDLLEMLVGELNLKAEANAIVNQLAGRDSVGYYGFIPTTTAGIYLTIWTEKQFFSIVLCTSKDFNERKAARRTGDFLKATQIDYALF